jgi:MFS transporter, SP family, inositol transporter
MSIPELREAKAVNPWYVGTIAGMASYIDAAALVASGMALVIYQQALGITDTEFGILSGVLTFSVAIGALFGGRLGDRFGRRSVFIATMATIIVGSALNVTAPGFSALLVGAVLVGLGTGADLPVSLATIAEAANDKNRGAIIGFSNVLWSFGTLATIVISVIVSGWGRLGGQLLYGHVGVMALIVLLLRLSIPESREWTRARDERARGIATIRADKASLRDLLSPRYARPFIALVGFYSLTNLAVNTSGQFGTKIAVDVIGLSVADNSMLSLVLFPIAIFSSLWFMKIVGTSQRMGYFVAGGMLMLASNFLPVILGFTVPVFVAGGILGILGTCFAFEGLMKVWAQESFPTLIRASAQGTIIAVARFAAGSLAFVTPGLLTALGPAGFYTSLGIVTATGLAFAWWGFHDRRPSEFQTETQADPAPQLVAD